MGRREGEGGGAGEGWTRAGESNLILRPCPLGNTVAQLLPVKTEIG